MVIYIKLKLYWSWVICFIARHHTVHCRVWEFYLNQEIFHDLFGLWWDWRFMAASNQLYTFLWGQMCALCVLDHIKYDPPLSHSTPTQQLKECGLLCTLYQTCMLSLYCCRDCYHVGSIFECRVLTLMEALKFTRTIIATKDAPHASTKDNFTIRVCICATIGLPTLLVPLTSDWSPPPLCWLEDSFIQNNTWKEAISLQTKRGRRILFNGRLSCWAVEGKNVCLSASFPASFNIRSLEASLANKQALIWNYIGNE